MSINYKKKYLKYKNKYYNLIQLKHKNIIKGGSIGIDSFIYGTLLGSIILLLYSGYVKYVNNDNNNNNAIYKSIKTCPNNKYEIKSLPDNYSIPDISEISEIKSNKIPSSKKDILKEPKELNKEPFIIKEDLNTGLLNQYDKKEIINDYSQPNVNVTKDDKIKTEQMPKHEQIDSKDLPDVKTILENIKNIVIKPPYKKSVLLVDDRYYDYKGNLNNNSYPGYFKELQNLISEKKDMSDFNVFASSDELSTKNDNHIQINIFEKDFINSDNIFDVVVYKQPDNINIEDFINNIKNILKIVSPNNGNGIFILNINILQSIDTIVDKIKNNLDNIQKYGIELINLNTEYVLKIKKKEIVENDMVQYKERDGTFNTEQIDKVNQETPFDNPTFNLKNRTTDTVWDKITKIEQPVPSAEQSVPSAEQPEQSIEQPVPSAEQPEQSIEQLVPSAEQSPVLETILNFEVNTIIKIEHNDTGEYIYGRVECNNNVQILTSKFNDLGLIKNEKYNTIPNTFTVTPTNMKIAHFPNLDNLDLTEVIQEGFSILDIKKLYVIHDERRVISVIKISTENEIEDQITIPDYQKKGLSTLLVDTLAKDIQENELYYIFTEHQHVKKMWESTKIFYSLDEQKSGDFIGLNNKTYNLDKNYWVLRNNNCTTMYIFFNSGDRTFSENRESAINQLGHTIPRFNITSIDFENKKKIHNDTEISLDNPNFNSDYMTNLFKNKFGEIKNAFITIMSHASDTTNDESKYRFGQDNIGFIYGTSFVNEVLDKSLYDNIVIYLATCYSNLLREYITRKKYPNIAIITGPLIAFGANYLSLNKSLRFIQDYNLEKSVKPFTMEIALSHMLGNQLIILDNYEGLDEQTIEEKFRNEPFISILREWNQTKKLEIGLVNDIAIDTITDLLEIKIKKYISEINDYEVHLQPILTLIDESYNETKDIANDSPILTEWYTSLKIFVQEFFENPDTNGFVKGRIYVPDKLSQESADLFFCKNR